MEVTKRRPNCGEPYSNNAISELVSTVLEIQVLKRLEDSGIRELREKCGTTYGATCGGGNPICMICLIRDDVRDITHLFEKRECKTDASK